MLLTLLGHQQRSKLLPELFNLSPAELLVLGLTPETCADRLGVSINTVRNPLRALFRKTNTTRHAELTGLIARIDQH